MKSNGSHLLHRTKCRQQKGTINLGAMMLVLVTILAITAIPNLSVILPSSLKEVIIAVLALQVASQPFGGGHGNH